MIYKYITQEVLTKILPEIVYGLVFLFMMFANKTACGNMFVLSRLGIFRLDMSSRILTSVYNIHAAAKAAWQSLESMGKNAAVKCSSRSNCWFCCLESDGWFTHCINKKNLLNGLQKLRVFYRIKPETEKIFQLKKIEKALFEVKPLGYLHTRNNEMEPLTKKQKAYRENVLHTGSYTTFSAIKSIEMPFTGIKSWISRNRREDKRRLKVFHSL